jgi:hypothetical protein
MSRFAQKPAAKGSQKWLQILVNQAPHLLDRAVARELSLGGTDKIVWLSPKAEDALAEYRDEAFLTKIGVELTRTPLSSFWPARGPQWDALGRTSRGEPLLVEAKAHIPELLSPACRATGKSLRAIRASLDRVKRAIGSRAVADWCETYYQYTNRLAHLYLLRSLNHVPAYLIFVYLLNDPDMSGPTTPEEWAGALELVHTQLGIDDERLAKACGSAVVDVFIDVKDIEAATA